MPHTFNPAFAAHLDNPLRRLLQPAAPILRRIGLAPGCVFLDIGAGTGYYSLSALALVGPAGRVVATDIEPRMVALLRAKGRRAEASNLEVIHSGAERLAVPEGSCDAALLGKVLHEVDDKEAALSAAFAALKRGGRIAVVEFKPDGTVFGPPRRERIGGPALETLFRDVGFVEPRTFGLGFSLYLATARKPEESA